MAGIEECCETFGGCVCFTCFVHLGESLMPAARVTNNMGAGGRLTVSWPPPENKNFLRGYIIVYTSIARSTSNESRQMLVGPPVITLYVSASMASTSLPFQPFSNYTVDVSALYDLPPSGDGVLVILLPTTTFSTPEQGETVSDIATTHSHTKLMIANMITL